MLFLLTISVYCVAGRWWESRQPSPRGCCFDVPANSNTSKVLQCCFFNHGHQTPFYANNRMKTWDVTASYADPRWAQRRSAQEARDVSNRFHTKWCIKASCALQKQRIYEHFYCFNTQKILVNWQTIFLCGFSRCSRTAGATNCDRFANESFSTKASRFRTRNIHVQCTLVIVSETTGYRYYIFTYRYVISYFYTSTCFVHLI